MDQVLVLTQSLLHTCPGNNTIEQWGVIGVNAERSGQFLFIWAFVCNYQHYQRQGKNLIHSESFGSIRRCCSFHVYLDLLWGSHTGKGRLLLGCLDWGRHLLLWGENSPGITCCWIHSYSLSPSKARWLCHEIPCLVGFSQCHASSQHRKTWEKTTTTQTGYLERQ